MTQKEIAQNRFIDAYGNSWYSTDLFYNIDFLNLDERFEEIEFIVKLKEPTEVEVLLNSQQRSEPF